MSTPRADSSPTRAGPDEGEFDVERIVGGDDDTAGVNEAAASPRR